MDISLEGIIVGLLAIAIGAAWATYGLKAFTILLPFWAFFVGLLAGANWGQEFLGEGFLGTTTSWVLGLVFGIVLAVLSYFWYYLAIVLLGGAVGYTLGAGLMFGLGLEGFLSIVVGLIVGAVFAIGIFVTGAPIFLVIILSALGGAAGIVNGALIFLGRIQFEDVQYGLMQGLWKDGFIAIGAWLVLAILGFGYQWRDVSRTAADMGAPGVDRTAYRIA